MMQFAPQTAAGTTQTFKIAWSVYVGWMPWLYAADIGIVKKWADKYGIAIEIVRCDSYFGSIDAFTAGKFDGCLMTALDALTGPAAAGVACTAVIAGDYSNGYDGIVSRTARSVDELKGRRVHLVKGSVSHFLLARALAGAGLATSDVDIIDTPDSEIVAAFTASPDATVVTWEPLLGAVQRVPGAKRLFDSADVPGEIADFMVVRSDTLAAYPELAKALAGAWYEAVALLQRSPTAVAAMATAYGSEGEEFARQLATTRPLADAGEAVAFVAAEQFNQTISLIYKFAFSKNCSADRHRAGGDADRMALRFDTTFMQLAADGRL